jgi:hypothetical protein
MTVRTEQQLADGVNITHEVKGRVYRSSQGVERWEGTAVATDAAMSQPATLVWVVDPVQHTAVNWNTNFKTAFTNHLPPNGTAVVKFLPEPRVAGGPPVAQAMVHDKILYALAEFDGILVRERGKNSDKTYLLC